jgi:hypothetical protein
VAAFFAVALVVGLRRAMALTRKALVLRSRKTEPINARPYHRQSIIAGSARARKSRVTYPTEKRTPAQQSVIRTTIAETQLSTTWRPFEEKHRESGRRSATAMAVPGERIHRATVKTRIERIGRAQTTIFGEMQMTCSLDF